MALNVKFLKGSASKYQEYIDQSRIEATAFYYIDEKDLYLGFTKLSNAEDLANAVANIIGNYGEGQTPATIYALEQAMIALGMPEGKSVQDLINEASTAVLKVVSNETARAKEAESIIQNLANAAKDRADSAYELAESKLDASLYAKDKAALEAEDAAIRAIAEEAKSAINEFLTSEEVDETISTLREIQAEIEKMADATELQTALASKADKVELEALASVVSEKQDKIPENTYDAYGSAEQALSNAKEDAANLYATKLYVGTIPEGYVETNIISYINKKAEETLNAANGGSSVAQALEDFKTEITPKVEKNTEDISTINEKLVNIEDGAQVNKIESVSHKEGAKLVVTTTDKAVEIDDSALVSLISAAQSKAEENANAISTLQGAVSGHTARFVGMGETDTVLSLVNEAKGLASTAQTTADNAIAAVNALENEKVKANTDAIAALDVRVAALDKENDGRVALIESNVAALDTRLTILDKENGRVASIENSVSAISEDVETLKSTITGLSGAMHWRGEVDSLEGLTGYQPGDVVTVAGSAQEYVYDGLEWKLFGDEGSYALKDSVYTKSDVYNKTEIDLKVSAINSEHETLIASAKEEAALDATSKANAAEANAKAYADAIMSWNDME